MLDFNEDSYQSTPRDPGGDPITPKNRSSKFEIMGASFRQGFHEFDPSPYINEKLYDWFDKSQVIPHDQLPPGIKEHVSRDTPITSNKLDYMQRVRTADEHDQNLLNYASDSFLSNSLSAVSGLAGTILSPGSIGIGIGAMAASPVAAAVGIADMAVPSAILKGISTLGETSTVSRVGLNIAKAGLGGSIAMGLMTPFQYARQVSLAYPGSYYDDTINNIKQGFYNGATFYVGGKVISKAFKGMIGTTKKWAFGGAQDAATSFDTAQNQAFENKSTNTNLLRENTFSQVKSKISDEDARVMSEDNARYLSQINEIDEKLSDIKPKVLDHESTASNLNKAVKILRKDPLKRSSMDAKFIDDLQDIPHYRDLIDAQTTLPIDRTDKQQSLLDNISDLSQEKNALKENIEDLKSLKDKFDSNKDKYESLSEVQKENHDAALLKVNDNIKKLQDRLKQIGSIQKDEQLNPHHNYHNIDLHRDGLQNMIDHNHAALNVYNEANPITNAQLRNEKESLKDVSTDGHYEPTLEDHYMNTYKDAYPKEQMSLDDIDREFEHLSDEDKSDVLKELGGHNEIVNQIPSAMKNLVNCLLGGG